MSMTVWVDVLEWSATVISLVGALLLATHSRVSRYGWLLYSVANIASIGFAIGIGRHGLLVQQLGFMVISLLGVYRAGFALPFCGRIAKASADPVATFKR